MTVRFYLKKPEPTTGKVRIYLRAKYNNKVLKFYFGQSISPKHWSSARQRVKSNTQTTTDGSILINDLLDNLVAACEKSYMEEIKNGIPEPGVLKSHLYAYMGRNDKKGVPTLYDLIDRFTSNQIKHKGQAKADNTIDKWC